MIRVPQLDTSTQFEEHPPRPARADLQFQSHQEHVQPLPPFLMPKLGVNTRPRIPPQAHLNPPSSIRIPTTSSNEPAKKVVDLLDDPLYLTVPVDILCDSVEAPRLFSTHDITEAYCVLLERAHHGIVTTKDVSRADRIFAALEHAKAQASIVCAAMQRDIRLAFVDPFLEVQPRAGASVASGSLAPSNTPSGASFVERKLTVHEEKRGKDRSVLCIRALQFLSSVFYAGPFQRIFSSEQLSLLLGDTLRITFAPELPSISAYKTRLFCFFILQSQSLPQEVLAPKALEMLRSLMKYAGKSPDANFKIECLKVAAKFLNQYPECFVPLFKEFLPSILQYLINDAADVRNYASKVLCALAQGTVSGNIPTHTRRSQSKEIVAFINANTARTSKIPKDSAVKLGPLAQRIHDALDNVDFETSKGPNTPSWALVVISSLIVLSDASFFLHSRCLKLVIPALSKVSTWKRGKGVQELHPVVWKCIVWAFARLREAERLAKTGASQPLEKAVDVKSVYSFSRQDLRSDIGVAVVATLLWTPNQGNVSIDSAKRTPSEVLKQQEVEDVEDVGNALGIVKDMLKNPDRHVKELGKKVLVRMLSGIGASTSVEGPDASKIVTGDWYNAFLAPQLFDDSIHSSPQANLLALANQIGGVDVGVVSRLSENEVSQHWDELIEIWAGLVSRLGSERKTNLPVDFTQMWQALLLSQTQLTQGLGHLATSPSLTATVADLLIGFLPPPNLHSPPSNPSPTDPSPIKPASTSSPVKRSQTNPAVGFMLVSKLWGVVKNVLASSCLSSMAGRILDAVVAKEYPLFVDEKFKDAWRGLCSDLVPACFTHAVALVLRPRSSSNNSDDSKLALVGAGVRREIWRMGAESWQNASTGVSWETGVQFLMVARREWEISPRDAELWDALLSSILKSGGAQDVTRFDILKRVTKEIAGTLTASVPDGNLVHSIVSCVELNETGQFPSEPFTLANEWLAKVHPAEENMDPAPKAIVQKLFLLIERTIAASPMFRCSSVVLSMSDALCVWIKDASEALSDAEYNETVMPFYETVLDVLRKSPPDIPTLHLLAPFLASVFVRIPPPARGPMAFKRFWDDTYKGSNVSFSAGDAQKYPPEIRGCLKAFHEVFGGDPPTGITFGSSQTTTPSTSRTGPSSPFFRGEISPLFKERVTEALRSSSPTTPTPPVRIRRGRLRVQRDVRESSAGPSSSSTQTPPSSPTSRNTRTVDRDARRLAKRPKLSHPRFGMLHETEVLSVGSQSGVAPQHVGKAGRRRLDQSLLPPLRGRSDGDGPHAATTTAVISGKIGKSRGGVGRSRLRPMGVVGGSGVNPNEVVARPARGGGDLRGRVDLHDEGPSCAGGEDGGAGGFDPETDTPKTEGRRRRLRNRCVSNPRADVLIPPAEANEDDGSAWVGGGGRITVSGEDTRTRAVSADSSRATHDSRMLPRPAQIGPSNVPVNPYSARSGSGVDPITASTNDGALQTHNSSTTVLMLENALAAVRDGASQLPLSDLMHASTMVRDLQSVLHEKLSRNRGDEEVVENVGSAVGREQVN